MARVNQKEETASYVSAVDWDEDVKYDYVIRIEGLELRECVGVLSEQLFWNLTKFLCKKSVFYDIYESFGYIIHLIKFLLVGSLL